MHGKNYNGTVQVRVPWLYMYGNFGQVFRHKISVLHEISLGETTILDFNWPVHKFKNFLQGYLLYFHCAVRTYTVRDLYM